MTPGVMSRRELLGATAAVAGLLPALYEREAT
jgi:hypothetical protein